MSACISSQGEYSDHVPGEGADAFLCQRCYVFDEDAALAEVAGLRTQLAALEEREALREKPWQERGVWALMKRAEPAMRDELMAAWAVRDETLASAAVLAGQVAAIRALAASYEARARNGQDYVVGRITVAEDIRAALVASSPTTPEAKK